MIQSITGLTWIGPRGVCVRFDAIVVTDLEGFVGVEIDVLVLWGARGLVFIVVGEPDDRGVESLGLVESTPDVVGSIEVGCADLVGIWVVEVKVVVVDSVEVVSDDVERISVAEVEAEFKAVDVVAAVLKNTSQ